ncbi:uncharacterized protein ACIQIH_018951 isoform 1-T1 [Cyanocitta cristata]
MRRRGPFPRARPFPAAASPEAAARAGRSQVSRAGRGRAAVSPARGLTESRGWLLPSEVTELPLRTSLRFLDYTLMNESDVTRSSTFGRSAQDALERWERKQKGNKGVFLLDFATGSSVLSEGAAPPSSEAPGL